MTTKVHEFINKLKQEKFNLAVGVPCGVLKEYISGFENDRGIINIKAQNEPEAIGIAAGGYLGGSYPIVYMQNSGFLKSINDIGSLMKPYKIPALLLMSYRGNAADNAPQHKFTGKITEPVLDMMAIPYVRNIENSEGLIKSIKEKGEVGAILIDRERYQTETKKTSSTLDIKEGGVFLDLLSGKGNLSRETAIDFILSKVNANWALFSTTGLISRSIYERGDSQNYFYNTGSFGMVSSLGLGFSISRPNIKTVVIDGDASVLTNFGTLVTIGHYAPKNLTHIVLDNESYGSCSGEKSLSYGDNISRTALIHGYKNTIIVDNKKGLISALEKNLECPTMIQVKIRPGGRRDFKRPMDLEKITKRFKAHFR